MNDKTEINYLGELAKVSLNPGDIVVLMIDKKISESDAFHIHEYLSGAFKDNKCVVLCDGMKIGVLGPDVDVETNG